MMKSKFNFYFGILLALFLAASACQQKPVVKTDSSTSVEASSSSAFIKRDLERDLVEVLGEPPAPQSALQKEDERILRLSQKTRTRAQCSRAKSEVEVTLGGLFGKPYGPLEDHQIEKAQNLISQVREEVGSYIGKMKKKFARKRPYVYMAGLKPCLPTEPSLAYPSGHAILSKLYALVLAEVYPELRKPLLDRAEVIAEDRVTGGVHHPSDILAGKKMADFLFAELVQSQAFDREVERIRNH